MSGELFAYLFFLCNGAGVKESLHRRLAETIAALVRPRLIILGHPDIEILLQFADRRIDLLAEGDAVELVEHGLVKPFDDAIGLRAPGLGAGMVDVLDSKVELVFVAVVGAAIFGAAIGENTLQHDAVLLVEGQDPVVQEIGRSDRRLAIIELDEANLRIGIDEGLLIDAADAFQGTHIEGVLHAAIAGTFGFELALDLPCKNGEPSPMKDRGGGDEREQTKAFHG